ncbi:MAG: IPT/TIG domain-containing protein [Candidatus Acidiferrales bacterium]
MRRTKIPLLLATLGLACLQFDCGGTSGAPSVGNPPPPNVVVTVSPSPASVRLGTPQKFSAMVTGSSNQGVSWQVDGVTGGTSAAGTIDASGNYTPPASLPNPNTATVTAVSAADSSATGDSAVTLLNPVPALTSVAPPSFPTGAFAITVNGSDFVSGAQVTFAGSALATTFVSATKLTATGNATTPGTFAVSVTNPNPGSMSSGSANVQVTGNSPPPSACSGFTPGVQSSLNGFVPFPANNLWNLNIANAAVDPNSAAIINFIGPSVGVHPDFGSGEYQGSNIGIPYVVVGAGQNFVGVDFTAYGDESDPGPMPIPANAPVEGDPNPGNGDRHSLIVDSANCWLYELYQAVPNGDGTWGAGSTAVWDLQNYNQRPLTWTSADAAGLPIFPGLARYDEVASGAINHALRFTLQNSRPAYVLPATHWAATSSNANAAPMGMRLRLKSSFDISTYSATNQVILKALQQYGLIMADNGSNMYISGDNDARWDNSDLHNLGSVTASDFEVVLMNPIYTQSNLPQGSAPVINSFTASSMSVTAGTQVTLSWDSPTASYFIVTPQVGAVRATSVVVAPAQSTTYTLIATNQFGRTTATVNITVQ